MTDEADAVNDTLDCFCQCYESAGSPRSNSCKLLVRVVTVLIGLFDLGTDWAEATTFYLHYRTLDETGLVEEAYHSCPINVKLHDTGTRDVEEGFKTVDERTGAISKALFIFAAAGTLILLLRLFHVWYQDDNVPESLKCLKSEGCSPPQICSSSYDIESVDLLKTSPFVNPAWSAILADHLAILLEDFPVTMINFFIIQNTCPPEEGGSVNIFLLLSAIGALLSSCMFVWRFALHVFFICCLQRFNLATEEDINENWSRKKKACIYTFVMLLFTFVAVALVVMMSFVLLWLSVVFIFLCCCCAEPKKYLKKLCSWKNIGGILRAFVLIFAVITLCINSIILVFVVKGGSFGNDNLRYGYKP